MSEIIGRENDVQRPDEDPNSTEQLLMCCVCIEYRERNTTNLLCGGMHVLCFSCLKEISSSASGGSIRCPLCRESVTHAVVAPLDRHFRSNSHQTKSELELFMEQNTFNTTQRRFNQISPYLISVGSLYEHRRQNQVREAVPLSILPRDVLAPHNYVAVSINTKDCHFRFTTHVRITVAQLALEVADPCYTICFIVHLGRTTESAPETVSSMTVVAQTRPVEFRTQRFALGCYVNSLKSLYMHSSTGMLGCLDRLMISLCSL